MLLASTYIQASPLHPAQPHTSNAHTQPTQGMKERADCAGRPQMRRPKCSSGAKAVTYLAWKIPVLNSCMKVFIASFQPSSDISGFTCVTPALCSWLHLNELILTLHWPLDVSTAQNWDRQVKDSKQLRNHQEVGDHPSESSGKQAALCWHLKLPSSTKLWKMGGRRLGKQMTQTRTSCRAGVQDLLKAPTWCEGEEKGLQTSRASWSRQDSYLLHCCHISQQGNLTTYLMLPKYSGRVKSCELLLGKLWPCHWEHGRSHLCEG